MTAFGTPYLNVCLRCREEFAPIEGNETREFCSDECEILWWDVQNECTGDCCADMAAQVYLEDHGRTPPWLQG